MENQNRDHARDSVLVFYCCITNDHKLKGLKLHPSIISQFLWARSPGTAYLGGSCASGHKAVISVFTGLHSHRGLTGEGFVSKLWL